jgi:uncharacterized protein (DUF488 family)
LKEFITCLKVNAVELVIDVRRFPKSSHCPHFNRESLIKSLSHKDIEYHWWGNKLGGYRNKEDGLGEKSPNKAWESEGFRIYADYMMSQRFRESIEKLIQAAKDKKTALMCAERFYWRCHRRLISDFLTAKGHNVIHIIDRYESRDHHLPEFAEVKHGELRYPANKG